MTLLVLRTFFAGLLLALLASCGSSGDDDGGQQYNAESLGGTWLLSAEYSWQLDDPALASRGDETMRSIVIIDVDGPDRATLRSCYPGVGEQQVEVDNNQFEFRLFDALLTFAIIGEGPSAPSIDFVTGAPIIPGPSSTRKVRAEADIDSQSGSVQLLGTARLLNISDVETSLTNASIRFAGADAMTLALGCFTEIVQLGEAGTADATRLHRVIASGEQQDTVVDIDIRATNRQITSGASMAYVDLQDSRQLRNAEPVSEQLFVVDGAQLSISMPLDDDDGSAEMELFFNPVVE